MPELRRESSTVKAGYATAAYWRYVYLTPGDLNDWISMHWVSGDGRVVEWHYIDYWPSPRTFYETDFTGTYEFRMFLNGVHVATSQRFEVVP